MLVILCFVMNFDSATLFEQRLPDKQSDKFGIVQEINAEDKILSSFSHNEACENDHVDFDESVIPIEKLLETIQDEMKDSDETKATQRADYLTYIDKLLHEDAQKVQIFFKNILRTVDLGIRGSATRQRSIATVQGMLQSLKDLWKWFCRRIFALVTWFKSDGSKKEMNELRNMSLEDKIKLLESQSKSRENQPPPQQATQGNGFHKETNPHMMTEEERKIHKEKMDKEIQKDESKKSSNWMVNVYRGVKRYLFHKDEIKPENTQSQDSSRKS